MILTLDHKSGFKDRIRNGTRQNVIAALDVGTTKVCCFIAKYDPSQTQSPLPYRIVGIGHQISRGMRKGAVTDLEAVEDAIRSAVETAEKMAGITLRQVVVNLSAGHPTSSRHTYHMPIAGQPVSDDDLRQLLSLAYQHYRPEGRTVVHACPTGYAIDDNRGVRDPRGMFGEILGVRMHMVSAASAPIRNLARCVERCHLELADLVVSPYASALACLDDDEAELGAVCVDMGGGTTTVSVFVEGSCVFADVIPLGGGHVTNDIARGLSTSIAGAERIKTLYGSALASATDDREMIEVRPVGEEDEDSTNQVARSILTQMIRPRLEETFEFVRDRLKDSGVENAIGKRMVLTGGASQLTGAREVAARILGKDVRLARPRRLAGLADAVGGPAFSTCAGLLIYTVACPPEAVIQESDLNGSNRNKDGQWAKLARWLKMNF